MSEPRVLILHIHAIGHLVSRTNKIGVVRALLVGVCVMSSRCLSNLFAATNDQKTKAYNAAIASNTDEYKGALLGSLLVELKARVGKD